MENRIAIYGAYGHTGKFILAELFRQGYKNLILSGRDQEKLMLLHREYPDLEIKAADLHDPKTLDDAFSGAKIIINCAGPYLDTAKPIIEAALRSGSHYIDLSAEQKAVLDVFEQFAEPAKNNKILIIPAAAFYGGLADLLSTALTQDWNEIDEINVYIGLDSWHPTKGTRLTGDRNHYKRLTFKDNRLQELEAGISKEWDFKNAIGIKEVVALPLSEIITISRHLNVNTINTFLSQNSLNDLRNNDTPEPKPVDSKNRSSQQFCVEVIAVKGNIRRTISAQGQDIYAVTAPLITESINRILSGSIKKNGVTTMGEVFDASDFLKSLNDDDIKITAIEESTLN
ncbi:trans-acting enoyl reductase family protein [Flavobacterium sp. CLA17]|uniref:saccharopine dehydrogenase family protein n=1 Tax=Flavobacterium sp. CLA17 TaxID=2724135 RepID=UPI001492B270|nr:saccharopine dehydrogenase NADP-binding domain-containing protein [Flavobacterium sp. CLA17]QSB25831.1 saccharopine dehydrogenase NADP-binding domain-containing protein [Flavobacterium sp. CLA17]